MLLYGISGSKQWSVKFNPKRKWNFVYATDSGYLCFCLNDWILEAYRTKANLSGTKSSSFSEKKTRNYPYPPCSKTSSTFLGPAIDEKTQKEIRAGLSKGGYGEKEIIYYIKQKLSGLVLASVGIITPFLLDGDATFSLIALPFGIWLLFTKEKVMMF